MVAGSKLSVTIPRELEQYARAEVASGRFKSIDEVLAAGLLLLEAADPLSLEAEGDIDSLRAQLQRGVKDADDGRFVAWEEVQRKVNALKAGRR